MSIVLLFVVLVVACCVFCVGRDIFVADHKAIGAAMMVCGLAAWAFVIYQLW